MHVDNGTETRYSLIYLQCVNGHSYPVVRRLICCAVNPDIVVCVGLCVITAKLKPDVFVTGVVRDVVHDQL